MSRQAHPWRARIAAHPEHPYALAGMDALAGGLAALREICARAGLNYVSGKTWRFGNLSV